MATTFRSGPRDPVTGRSSAVVSDPGNIVRADGRTDNERSQMASQFTADPGQEQQYQQAERAYQEFLQSSGRSSTNPYGNSGLFGGGANFTNSMTPGQIEDVNRLAYNQYLGLVSGQGTQRGGQGEFVPGYAPALKIGSNTPRGRVVAAPTQPKRGGIADFFKLSPTLGLLQGLFGSGNIPRTLDDGGVDYSTEGIETLDAAPVLKPGEAAAPAPSYTLASAQNQDNNKFTIPFLGKFLDFPRDGVGSFLNQKKGGIQLGPGELRPEIKEDGFGLKYTIPISTAGANTQSAPVAESLFAQDLRRRVDDFSKGNPLDALISQQQMNKMLQMGDETGVYMNPVTLMDQADETNMGIFLESRDPITGEERPILRPEDTYERIIKADPKFKSINELEENRLFLDDLNRQGQLFYGV